MIPPCHDVCSTKKYLSQPAQLFEAIFNLQGVGIVIDKVPNPLTVESEAGNLSVCLVMTVHNVQFVKYDVTVSFMAQVLDTASSSNCLVRFY